MLITLGSCLEHLKFNLQEKSSIYKPFFSPRPIMEGVNCNLIVKVNKMYHQRMLPSFVIVFIPKAQSTASIKPCACL